MPLDLFESLDNRVDDGARRLSATAAGDLETEFAATTRACGEEALSLC